MLSRIDGTTTIAELAEETGKSLHELEELLGRLVQHGALALEDPPISQQGRRPSLAPIPRPSGAFHVGRIVETSAVTDLKHPAASLYESSELEEAVDIELPRRRRILELYHQLDQLTHYQLFGVEPSADKKAIKAAYFEIVNVFHPDRYFGKNVGSFKAKLEKVFARLTEGYNVLSRNASRAEYDSYLRAQSKTRAFDAGQADNSAHEAALQEVLRRVQAEANSGHHGPSAPASAPGSSRGPSIPPHQSLGPPPRDSLNPPPRPSSSIRPTDPEVRRKALARKLGLSVPPSASATDAERDSRAEEQRRQTAQEDSVRQEWAADELRRRYQDRVQQSRDQQVDVYARAARQALEKGDNVGAANALRLAVSLAPKDATLNEQLNEVAAKARRDLSESYLAQGEYEERDEKWLAAAKSYSRALTGRPEARIYDKVAHCLLSGEGDVREAGEMAKKAVLMQPDSARFRVTLARFYVKAGMKQSAQGELSRAATLGATDDKVTDWIRRLRRELG